MKRKLLSLALSAGLVATSLSSLAGCGKATGEIKIWVAENVVEFTKSQVAAFQEANPKYSGFTIIVEPVGEGDAATNMVTDVEAGADIYGFPQDQLSRLVAAQAITPIGDADASWVAQQNDAGSVGAAKVGDITYAYPITSDNGYFLYYDKSVVSDPSTLEGIVKACESAGKSFYMEINSGWYQTAFFFGDNGCTLTYDTDSTGAFTACNATYASDAGVKALRNMINLHMSPAFVNGSSISNATNVGAIVDGTWDAGAAKDLFGDNYACAPLPTVGGVQMSGFGGFKLLGVKPQTDADKLEACKAIAKYLSSAEVQLARYDEVFWGPSNITAQQSDKVTSDAALSALGQQLAHTVPQGQYPGDYWSLATALGDSIIAGDYDNATDAQLLQVLQDFQDTCASYAQ
jgi:arabinogalactan oligomer/maltooligosaccharide transport system substrate-binding protein